MAIPVILLYFIRKRPDAPFPRIFWMFGTFIVLCGLTHLVEVITSWQPWYRFSLAVKIATGAVSLATVALLVRLVPKALALRSPAELERSLEETARAQEELAAAVRKLEDRDVEQSTKLRQAREQLLQSKKLEAIGKLAGGIAHDFNNLLQVINGYSGMALGALHAGDPLREYVDQIHQAGGRAAALTRQLLAFSRKQRLQPRVVSLNRTVRQMEKMLRQLLPEHVEIRTRLEEALGPVLVDPAQIEQVILNLVINARDAMPRGGALTIETANVVLDEAAREHVRSAEGGTVMLSVTDTGVGMDRETLSRLFDPFFTTKPVGQGTGLGLATVYGIISQSGGHITVRSEPDRGASFRIHLPRASEEPAAPSPAPGSLPSPGGRETILVVEDNEAVRSLVRAVLKASGYEVVEAAGPQQALALLPGLRGRLRLVISDMMMPGMSGPELTARLAVECPGVRVLYMTGHFDLPAGVSRADLPLIEKPFTPERLSTEVRRLLDC